jgi:hypothetical protein
MPHGGFSTMSSMPMPYFAPTALSFSMSSTGPSVSPLTETGMPFSNRSQRSWIHPVRLRFFEIR